MEPLKKATIIEGIASTMHKDVQGERLDLDGADISALEEGRGFANSDHKQDFNSLVGRVVGAKKIKSLSDCETPTQVKYYEQLGHEPFIWTKLELWDGVGHKEADSIASIYKFYQEKGEEAPIKLSVEGKTLERGAGGLLKRTQIRGVAITVHPANRKTKTDVVSIVKSMGGNEALVKSETYKVPLFIESKSETPLERIFDLAIMARDLLKSVSNIGKANNSEAGQLQCQVALERLRNLKAQA